MKKFIFLFLLSVFILTSCNTVKTLPADMKFAKQLKQSKKIKSYAMIKKQNCN